jgi:xanthine dehydrogenase accessory factor
VTRDVLARIRRDLAEKRPAVLATSLSTGTAQLLHPFEDERAGDPALRAAARQAALEDQSRVVETPDGEVFLHVLNPPVRVIIVGAVHVAQALAQMVRQAGYDALVVDPRRAFATAERFPGIPLSAEWPDEAMARAGLDRRTAVVAMTHDPKIDDPALAAALRSPSFYVGALGSRKTQAARAERLRGLGFTDADLSRIHGPVGLRIGAVSPGEIAVSILAELVDRLRRPAGSEARAGA